MLSHCVQGVEMGTAPKHLAFIGNARLNFTFRSAPNILGKEKDFASERYWTDS